MLRLVGFELKKLLRNGLLIGMTVLLCIVNFCKIYSGYARENTAEGYREGYFAMYEKVSGPWDTEKIRWVIAEYEKARAIVAAGNYATEPHQPGTYTGYIFGDCGLLGEIKDRMDTLYHYDQTVSALTQKANENAAFYTQKGNAADAAKNQKIAQTYGGRHVPAFYDTWGISAYLKYDLSTLLILIVLIPMLSPLFAREHENGMHGLNLLTPQYRKLPLAKLIAGAFAVLIVSMIFFAEDLIAFRILYHIRGFSQPVYSLPEHFYSTLSCTVSEYILLLDALKVLCFFVLGAICAGISACVRNELIPFCISSAAALILLLVNVLSESKMLTVINPVV